MAVEATKIFPIYLARHGETEFNVERRWQGAGNDSPLTAQGARQARETGLILREFVDFRRPPRFVASPLGRARATMEIMLETLNLPRDHYATDARLVELDLGEWTGLLTDQIRVEDRARWDARQRDKWNVPCPGGESYSMAVRRAEDWLANLSGETVAVSHGVFGRILRTLYQGLSWEEISSLDSPQGCVFRLHEGAIARMDFDAQRHRSV